ncbi:FecR family protein [Pedobacter frigidisoli]|uniref:FecR family protein n=1 Tax=Pedobacter frigidisoli TaxID=2530455 RepID=UPI00292E1919|nr:FecR domain-containing protein [Pedobacter frigidisoli]
MDQRINYLLHRFTEAKLSSVERQELLQLAEEYPLLINSEIVKLIEAQMVDRTIDDQQSWDSVLETILASDKPKLKTVKSINLKWWWAAAAVVLIVFSLSTYVNVTRQKEHVFATDFAPGSNKAILTLANGTRISLNDAAAGDLMEDAGMAVTKTANGQLVYHIVKSSEATDDSKTNTITTPNGGEWQIKLPDGSTVWLNAASSLTYPLNLGNGKKREVLLAGEAYFEVAKDKLHPFIVKTSKQEVTVLGTHFNVNSYADEVVTRTTLLEGSVRIVNFENGQGEVLKPGEQSVLNNGMFRVDEVDTDESIAWKNGYFMFNNEKQESILRKIARWYDVKVEFADQSARNVMYYGTVSRFDKISQVLRKFEQTGEVRFDIKDKKLIVYKD